MYRTQPRLMPQRIFEPNIIHNPKTWMGIWTPQGWRVNPKRWGKARPVTVRLSGDGKTTFFPDALKDPATGKVQWQDDLHLKDDPFSDRGIYPSDPRVEYPAGRPRWAVSHTLLCYPVADHNLYTHEYTWNMTHGFLQTHFRHHVALEEARTDSRDGMTVEVRHKPISQTIEANNHYPLPNSAVRGVWSSTDKSGRNYYTRRLTQRVWMHNSVYGFAPHVPVVQCYGLWAVLPGDPMDDLFDADTGECTDRQRVIEQLRIPLDEPKIAMALFPMHQVPSKVYEGTISQVSNHEGVVGEAYLQRLRARKGCRFRPGLVGFAEKQFRKAPDDLLHCVGYCQAFDLNNDGVIDDADEALLARHLGRAYRYNLYFDAYFGGDWLTTSVALIPEHEPGVPVIADYEYGGGYDGQAGIIRLLQTPGPNQPVFVEYHHDAPAAAGENNIAVHLFHEEA